MSYIVINRVNSDGDFAYEKQNSLSKKCSNKEEIFEYIKDVMTSLLNIDTSRDWLKNDIPEISKKWLKYYYNNVYLVPSFDFGNQQIEFEILYFDDTQLESLKDQQESNQFVKITMWEIQQLSPIEYIEYNTYFNNMTEEDYEKFNCEFNNNEDVTLQDQLHFLRSLKNN